VDNGIVMLCRKPYDSYSEGDELDRSLAAHFVSQASTEGVQKAIGQTLRLFGRSKAHWVGRFINDLSRSLLTELIDLKETDVALDHGCGWGNHTCHLARTARRVVAMDLVAHRARFTGIRAQQSGLDNVVPLVSGDYERLPFPADYFDVVHMNGVLEWVPYALPGNPKRVQERRLQEIVRILKPGGQLLLAIENRYWWRYFKGQPEEHTGIKWVALVPRRMANILARLQGKQEFRAYTYSLNDYRRLLRHAGFGRIDAYISMPDYNMPDVVFPVADKAALRHVYYGSTGKKRLKGWRDMAIRCGLLSYGAHSFAFVCRKPVTV